MILEVFSSLNDSMIMRMFTLQALSTDLTRSDIYLCTSLSYSLNDEEHGDREN